MQENNNILAMPYSYVKLKTAIKLGGRHFAEIDKELIQKESNIDLNIKAQPYGVAIDYIFNKELVNIFVPYEGVVYLKNTTKGPS